ncbi:MAG TPA: cupin domain-containing protein [Chitinophagaceae bacterium]|nr:cupin domain-containing protein [Chitinophagaceae bacterium]
MNASPMIEKKQFKMFSDAVREPYANFLLEEVNDHCLRLAVMEEAYQWHYHEKTDELFIVLEGQLMIEFRDAPAIILSPGEFIKLPARTIHKTSAIGRTVNLCFEKTGTDTIFLEE